MKTLRKSILPTITLLVLGACSSSPKKVEKIEPALTEVKGNVAGADIGLNKNDEAYVQEKQSLEDKLRKQRWSNAESEQVLRSNHDQLTRCQNDLANPLLDGNGEKPDVPEVDAAMDFSKQKTQFGLDESGNLVFVTKESVQDRINRETRYAESLASNGRVVKKHLDKCLFKMGIARQKKGLSPTWYFRDEVKGYEYETDLSVAFKNAQKDKAKSGQ